MDLEKNKERQRQAVEEMKYLIGLFLMQKLEVEVVMNHNDQYDVFEF